MSFRYFARGSPSFLVSAIATGTFPASSTTSPSASSFASSPATRTADGPISTPRRDCPKSSGTPITRIFREGTWVGALCGREGSSLRSFGSGMRHHRFSSRSSLAHRAMKISFSKSSNYEIARLPQYFTGTFYAACAGREWSRARVRARRSRPLPVRFPFRNLRAARHRTCAGRGTT